MAGFYDGVLYRQCDSLAALVDLLLRKKNRGKVIFAHNGGRFDFLFLMEYIREERGRVVKMIVRGSSIIALKIKCGKRDWITIQDSYALLPHSLDKLCDTFNPKTKKLRGVVDFEKEKISKENEKHREYLEADCKSLWEILFQYSQLPYVCDVGFRATLASTALASWRTTLRRRIKTTSGGIQNFCREAYAGGRTEIFRQVMGRGACFDVNSLYPTMMLKPLPVEHLRASNNIEDFGFHEVTVEVPECYVPVLWTKTPKLIFPTGTFRGVYFSEELRLAIECGARIVKHHRGEKFSARSDLFEEYIAECYKWRLENPGTSLDFLGKMLMNNTYGKFGEREEKDTLIKVDPSNPRTWPKEGFAPWHSEEMFQKTGLVTIKKAVRQVHMLVHIAAAITAWARVHMARTLYLPQAENLYYTDTDSGFISGEIPTGKGLGEWKEEYKIRSGFFLLPKGYFIEKENGEVVKKLKGFSKKSLDKIGLSDFRAGKINSAERKLGTFRTSLIRKNSYLSMIDVKKSVVSEYSKRKILAGGDTRPWEITKNGEIR